MSSCDDSGINRCRETVKADIDDTSCGVKRRVKLSRCVVTVGWGNELFGLEKLPEVRDRDR